MCVSEQVDGSDLKSKLRRHCTPLGLVFCYAGLLRGFLRYPSFGGGHANGRKNYSVSASRGKRKDVKERGGRRKKKRRRKGSRGGGGREEEEKH